MKNKLAESYIYKYTSYDIGELIICSQLLKFNSSQFFNDPFDSDIDLLYFDFNQIGEDVEADLQKLRTRADIDNIPIDILTKAYKNTQKRKVNASSICCFSKSFKNTVMWAHYSDNHNGVCFIFDRDCKEPFSNFKLDRFSYGEVDYNNYSAINYLTSKFEGMKKIYFTKSADWAYEEEYRYVLKEKRGYIKFNKEYLKGIIFGLNVKEENILRIKSVCEKNKYSNLLFGQFKKKNLKMELFEI
ncbi:MAG: DUF2971 domain-containing protein [Bacteroidales bacterium]|nr:DUF2971 domain-containing protein [Bacteroidales bacterium]